MVADDGSVQRLAVVAADPDNAALAEIIQHTAPIDPDAPFGAPAVLRTGQSQLHECVAKTLLPGLANHWRSMLETLRIMSMMSVPLAGREHTLGVITFATAESGRTYGPDDLSLAEDLASRAAIAIDNARLYNEARQAIRLRDVFLSVASHELKTPLTSLSGNAQMLERRVTRNPNLNERDRRALHVIVEQARRLNQMITTLLDVSRIQNDQLSIECTPVDIDFLLKRLVDELTSTLDQHTLVYSGAAKPLLVKGDELRLEQVFHNLIQNAVKYSIDGGVITLRAEQQENMVVVSVTDKGIGIPHNALPYVFNRFYRASNVNAQNISGIGLGLYVVHQIVSLHNGVIDVTSEEGRGSTFTVRIPLMQSTTPTDTPDVQAPAAPYPPLRMVE
jgi:signal transduction histidine kinase